MKMNANSLNVCTWLYGCFFICINLISLSAQMELVFVVFSFDFWNNRKNYRKIFKLFGLNIYIAEVKKNWSCFWDFSSFSQYCSTANWFEYVHCHRTCISSFATAIQISNRINLKLSNSISMDCLFACYHCDFHATILHSIRDVIVFTSDCTTEKETIKIFQCLRLISRQAMRNVWFNLQTGGCFNFVSFFVVVPLSRWETTRGLLFVPLKCQSSLFATKDQPFTVHTILCLSSEGIRISSRVFNILNSLKCHLLPWMHEWMNEWTRRMSNCIQQFFFSLKNLKAQTAMELCTFYEFE